MRRARRVLAGLAALVVATAVWLPAVHLLYTGNTDRYFADEGVPPGGRELARRHLDLWEDADLRAAEIDRMRLRNAEWDFMGRSYLVWALANMALRRPESKAAYLAVMDRIIDETMAVEREKGCRHFLMAYGQSGRFVVEPQRSHFVDGEVALMLGMRRVVEEKAAYRAPFTERVDLMVERMGRSRVLSAESYPNECWLFCNVVALDAIRVADYLDGTDHAAFFREWIETAKARLTHTGTGLLNSSYTVNGMTKDGPEGSTIWMAAHGLQIIDPAFSRDQYDRAKRELAVTALGFGYAKEWPASRRGPMDVDSGPIIPVLEVSAGASGQAVVGAAAFSDRTYLAHLLSTLRFAAFPQRRRGALRFAASNQVGDAVLLYAAVQGPMWERVGRPVPPASSRPLVGAPTTSSFSADAHNPHPVPLHGRERGEHAEVSHDG